MLTTRKIKCKECGIDTFSGKKGLCPKHYNLQVKAKKKVKRETKQELAKYSEKSLDNLMSKIVRNLSEPKCYACKMPLEVKSLQNGHLVSRQVRVLRYDFRNTRPVCRTCNFYDQTHVFELAKEIDIFFGKGTSDRILSYKHIIVKYNIEERKLIYEILNHALTNGIKSAVEYGIKLGIYLT